MHHRNLKAAEGGGGGGVRMICHHEMQVTYYNYIYASEW